MEYYTEALFRALQLIITLDQEVIEVVMTSLKLSVSSTFIASVISIPLAIFIARHHFKSRKFLNIILNTLLSLPTVVIGIFVYSIISRRGVLGELELLFTPVSIIIGQVILLIPLITVLVRNVIYSLDEKLYKT
ncbi:MAG: ABC transporter permease, partial [Halanaerobium sp.]